MADDNGISALRSRHHGQVLEDSICPNAVGQLSQITQVFSWVIRVGVELLDRNINQTVAGVIVVISQRRKEGLVHGLPVPPVTNRLLVVDVVALAGVRRIVGTLELLADIFTCLPFALRL